MYQKTEEFIERLRDEKTRAVAAEEELLTTAWGSSEEPTDEQRDAADELAKVLEAALAAAERAALHL